MNKYSKSEAISLVESGDYNALSEEDKKLVIVALKGDTESEEEWTSSDWNNSGCIDF
jgi:hypothetical protein